MNRLPRVLITLATASAFALCARAQTPPLRVVPESEAQSAPVEERSAPEAVEGADAEKARVEFEGLSFFNEEYVRGELRGEHLITKKSPALDPARIDDAARVLKKLYTRYGFLGASVEVREEQTGARPRLFTLAVDEGERGRLEEIRFEGGARVPAARMVEATEKCLERLFDSEEAATWREAYDYERLEYCVSDARKVLKSEGFVKPELGDPKVEAVGRTLRVTVKVEEGTRYRNGRIKVRGATVFLPAQIVEMLDSRPGEFADEPKAAKALSERLWQEYTDRGYYRFTYDTDATFRPTPKRKGEGVVDLNIDIQEGMRFTVSSIEFVGDKGLKTVGELKSALGLSEGDVFGMSRFQDGLERLRQMGVFGGFYWENMGGRSSSRIQVSADDDKGLVSLRIFLGERNP